MRFLTSRLWPKLAAICVAIAVVPILVGGVLITDRVERHTRALAESHVNSSADLAAASTHRYARGAASKLTSLARLMYARQRSYGLWTDEVRDDLVDWLEGQVEPPGLFLSLEYEAMSPVKRLSVQQVALPRNPDTPFLPNDGPDSSPRPPIGTVCEERFDCITVPLSASVTPGVRMGSPFPRLVAYLDLGELTAQLQALTSGVEELGIELVDSAGTRMIAVGRVPSPDDCRLVTRRIAELDWRIEVRSSRTAARATADVARQQVWGITLVAGASAAVLALLVSFWLVRPIRRLKRAATDMADGDLTVRAALRRNDEIGELGAAFDRMADAVERLDRAKSDFAATVSHELRTPLTALTANVQNLVDGIHGPLADPQRNAAERLADEIGRLCGIVDETLQLSRLEAGAEPCRIARCDLRQVAEATIAERTVAARARNLTLEISGSGAAQADAKLLRRALGNLLDNAIAFAPAGSAVTVELAPDSLAVRDRGPGLLLDRPFEPFAQGSTDGRKNPGVGLGLAIVARIVKLHGGEVAAQNDGGAVVTIRLPESPSA